MSGYYLYLTSHPTEAFPSNTPDSFSNRVRSLVLDRNKSWEIGLANIFFPKTRKILESGDASFGAEILIRFKATDDVGLLNSNLIKFDLAEKRTYLPSKSLFTNESNESLINTLNEDIAGTFHKFYIGPHSQELYDYRQTFLSNIKVVQYDESKNRAYISNHREDSYQGKHQSLWREILGGDEEIEKISISFSDLLGETLGFNPLEEYVLYEGNMSQDYMDDYKRLYAPRPPRIDGGVSQILIYSDLVSLTRYSSEMTNILDVLPVAGGRVKLTSILYKELKPTWEINDASVLLRCQRGRPILFQDGSEVLAVVHIRERGRM